MSHNHNHSRCFAPPHPALLANIKRQQMQGSADTGEIQELKTSLPQQNGIVGLNDGTIFPKTHFPPTASVSKMAAAARERKPLRNAIKVIVVVVDFQDVKCPPGIIQRTQDLWFSTDKRIPTGSVSEYYSEVSNNMISLVGEVKGPFTLRKEMAFYANKQSGMGFPEPNTQTMADEAFLAAKDQIDFKPYDNDGNGQVDAFVVVHAGRAAEETGLGSDIWSVKWVLPRERRANGVGIFAFLTVPFDAKCGVCAHEVGHLVFGWPDLYDTDQTSAGIGNWCLMASGSWGGGGNRPVHPSAWCKSTQGWVETVVETSNRSLTLPDVKTGHKIHRLWTNGDANSAEYFLVENRQRTQGDVALPGGGLLIWHVDVTVGSNTNENHPMIKLMQADGLDQLKGNLSRGDDGDVYPGATENRNFNVISNPSSRSYTGADTLVSVTKIPSASTVMTFDITVRKNDQPPPGSFDPRIWYRLRNTYQPATHCLGTKPNDSIGLVQMVASDNSPGQHWQLKPNEDGSYSLRTLLLGPDRRLGVQNDKKTPVLQTSSPYAEGQYWTIRAWDNPRDGTWHLENEWTEQFQYLDTMEGGPKVEMNQANNGRPTQRWTIEPIRAITESGF